MYGKDYPYAQSRIQGTVVRLLKNGEPVYVVYVNAYGSCGVTPIEEDWGDHDKTVVVHVDDLDLHPVPLGYVNCAGEATYLMRIPMRRDWKQGLRQENCWSSGRRFMQIPMKDIKNCIMDRFPTFDKALKDVSESVRKIKIIAWHRNWAVSTSGQVLYKNHEIVGGVIEDKIVLNPSFQYLKEALAESMK